MIINVHKILSASSTINLLALHVHDEELGRVDSRGRLQMQTGHKHLATCQSAARKLVTLACMHAWSS
jgi:hypothetical protein